MILTGCCGWGYLRIPEDLKKDYRSVLSYYSSLFDVVEVNSTFYHIPNISIAEKWRQEVRSDFVFTVKVSRVITHLDRFSTDKSRDLISFYIDFAEKLDATILLFQLPSTFPEKNMNNMSAVLKSFHDTAVRFAVEARNLSLEKRNEFAMETDTIPVIDPFTAIDSSFRPRAIHNTSYFRLHGSPPSKVMYGYDYTDCDLERLLSYIQPVKDYNVYVLFNNTEMYKNALRFKEMVS